MIRFGKIGRRTIEIAAWVMLVGAVAAAAFGDWTRSVQLGLMAAVCKGALIWDELKRADTENDHETADNVD